MTRHAFRLLPYFLAFDLLLPFLIAPAYKGYSHRLQVMSVLGNPKSPVHILYNAWLILLGAVILAASVRILAVVSESSPALGRMLFFILLIYAAGGCILSGIFSVGETKSVETVSAKIHGAGSAAGFLFLTFAPLFIARYFFKTAHTAAGIASSACFVFALGFFVLFVMADKPNFSGTPVAWEGLWQRLTLLNMYVPVALLCIVRT